MMTRRALLALPLLKPRAADAPVPLVSDIDRLNAFADRYNAYVDQIRRGVVDLRLWNQLVSGWRKLIQ